MGTNFNSVELSSEDANALILPVKSKKKKELKASNLGKAMGVPHLSKSQKRKLKKLQEEQEQKALEMKSIKILEKYKIKDDAYSLLKTSGTIGHVETMREKRLRAVQFSKAGLELPVDIPPPKKSRLKQIVNDDAVPQPKEGDVADPCGAVNVFCDPVFESVGSLIKTEAALPKSETSDDEEATHIQEDQESYATPCNGGSHAKLQDEDGKILKTDPQIGAINNAEVPKFSKGRLVVHVTRPTEIESKRQDLPIVMMEQEIMEVINENSSTIICGETGCGKTTQVPQFLYEAGFGSSIFGDRKGIIGITQPRRVAVLATAKRVAFELGLCLGKEVGFQVRHDKILGANCSIKFMTDGILLREVQSDFLLRRYSVILLDEAHERSLNTDILIGMLSRVIQMRQQLFAEQQAKILQSVDICSENLITPLKVILMSATLRVEDFISNKRLFCVPPPVIEVPTRQFSVTIHFSKRTEIVDYVGQAYKKVMTIHKRLPPGGILVFVTGQREVEYLCRKLRRASKQLILTNKYEKEHSNTLPPTDVGKNVLGPDMKELSEAFEVEGYDCNQIETFKSHDDELENSEWCFRSFGSKRDGKALDEDDDDDDDDDEEEEEEEDKDNEDQNMSLVDGISNDTGGMESIFMKHESVASLKAAFEALAGKKPNEDCEEMTDANMNTTEGLWKKHGAGVSHGALHILPLYAMLPTSAQLRVFEDVPDGQRLVVVATNVAETSLTIPGIKYVVDTGREKVKTYNYNNGMATYEVQWISKASAAQRAGRAGRTGPGHCYRLYSSAVFNNIFSDFTSAEITKIPVDGVVLFMKFMSIDKVANFPFPTPPETSALVAAEKCLKALEALDMDGKLTPMGKAMAQYPMSPRHSRMLLTVVEIMKKRQNYSRANLVLGYAVAVAAALSLSNPFIMLLGESKCDRDDELQDKKLDCTFSDQGGKGIKRDGKKMLIHEARLKRKKLKATAKEARSRFCNPSSDALTIAYALQMFELSGNPVLFCSNYFLHYKTMDEMSKLRNQLLQLMFRQSSVAMLQELSWDQGSIEDVEKAWRIPSEKHPLLLDEEELLGQAICAGWADRVARRIKSVTELPDTDKKVNSVRYQSCMLNDTIYLHRWSSVSLSAPEFVVYNELLNTKRPYMHGVTSVKSHWLAKYARAMCTFSAPLTEPKPYYEPLTDQVLCWVTPTFGPHMWQLPLHSIPISDNKLRASVFACALLEGNVLPCLRFEKKFLAANPASILRPEARCKTRDENLLNKLINRRRTIDSRAALREAWKINREELRSEISDWFQEDFRRKFGTLWDQMHCQVVMEAAELFPRRLKKTKRKKENF